jgi:hypothetical protein
LLAYRRHTAKVIAIRESQDTRNPSKSKAFILVSHSSTQTLGSGLRSLKLTKTTASKREGKS